MAKQLRVLTSGLIMLLFLLPIIPQNLLADEGKPKEEQKIKAQFETAIREALLKEIADRESIRRPAYSVEAIAKEALAKQSEELRKEYLLGVDSSLNNMIQKLSTLLSNNTASLIKDATVTANDAVQVCMDQLLDETKLALEAEKKKTSQLFKTHLLSDYRFLLGGSWTHSEEEGPTKSIFTAELFIRTRWLDSRKGNPILIKDGNGKDAIEYLTDISREHLFDEEGPYKERGFLDLLVDAQFVTNQPFNKVILDSVKATSGQFFLESVSSSNLSVALFWSPCGPVLFDWGTFGPFARFEISTREQSADIFRRMIIGLRIENRAPLVLNGASVELGFTRDRTAGSLEQDKEIFGVNRIMLNMELPMTNDEQRLGLYAQFHGEWPLGHQDNSSKIGNVTYTGLLSPPVYQFRFGATFDPIKLFGPLFGVEK